MTDPGPLGLVEEPAHQAGEVDAEDGRDEVQTRGPAQRLLPRGLVVPVEAGVGPGRAAVRTLTSCADSRSATREPVLPVAPRTRTWLVSVRFMHS